MLTARPESELRDRVVHDFVVTIFCVSHCFWVMWNPITIDLWHQHGYLALRRDTFLFCRPFPIMKWYIYPIWKSLVVTLGKTLTTVCNSTSVSQMRCLRGSWGSCHSASNGSCALVAWPWGYPFGCTVSAHDLHSRRLPGPSVPGHTWFVLLFWVTTQSTRQTELLPQIEPNRRTR